MATLSPEYMIDRLTDEIYRSSSRRITTAEARTMADRLVTELFLRDGTHEMADRARSCLGEIRAMTLRPKAHSSLNPPIMRHEVVAVLDKWGFRDVRTQ